MNLKRRLLVKAYRFYLKKKHQRQGSHAVTETQRLVIQILKNLLRSPEVELQREHGSETFYLKRGDVYAKIILDVGKQHVVIVNGKYFYDVHVPAAALSDVVTLFKQRLEGKRKKFEESLTVKSNDFLKNILEEIKEKTTTN